MSNSIHIKKLSFAYGKDIILNDVNMSFPEGKLSVILGRNGSGKSTLFNIIAGLEKNIMDQFLSVKQNVAIGRLVGPIH